MKDCIILGAGPTGSLLGAILSNKAKNIHLIGKESLCYVREKIAIDENIKQNYFPKVNEKLNSIEPSSIVLVTGKATELEENLTQIIPFIKSDTIIVVLHNGVGIYQLAKKILKNNCKILRGVSYLIADQLEDGKIHLLGGNQIVISQGPGDQEIVNLFSETPIQIKVTTDIRKDVIKKAIINAIINPLTAIEGIKIKELKQEKYVKTIEGMIIELTQLAKFEDIHLNEKELWNLLNQVITIAGQSQTSMTKDLSEGRQTEIDFITGPLIQKGLEYGIPMPYNTFVYNLIKNKELSKSA